MNPDLVILIVVAGLATYAFRVLPLRLTALQERRDGPLGRFLAATGPAAIATLAAVSALPLVAAAPAGGLPLAAGTAAVLGLWAWRRSVVLATLGGPLAYGLALAALA